MNAVLRQYNDIKKNHPDSILLLHVGSFYETFDKDAVIVSQALGTFLSSRPEMIFTTGFPDVNIGDYLPKLVRMGYSVAIVDQI